MSEGCKKVRQNLKLQAILQRGYFHILFPLFNLYWQIGRSLNSEELLVIFRGGSRPSDKERRGGGGAPPLDPPLIFENFIVMGSWRAHYHRMPSCKYQTLISVVDVLEHGQRSRPLFQREANGEAIDMKMIFLFSCKWNSFSHERFYTEHVLKMWIFNTSERDTFFSLFFCRGKGGKDSGEEKLLSSNFSNSFQRPYAMYKL